MTPPATTILIVEDERLIARDLQRQLEKAGYQVVGPVATGAEALALSKLRHPDIVLMDIILQGDIDGIQTATQMTAHHDLPVVFLTAHSDPATVQRAKLISPYGYLVKPFHERDLFITLDMALFRGQSEKEIHLRDRAIAAVSSGVIIVDLEQTGYPVVYCNNAYERLTGYQTQTVLNHPYNFHAGPDTSREALKQLQQALAEKHEIQITLQCYRQNQTSFWDDILLSPVYDKGGQVTHAVIVHNDVTQRVETDETVRHLNASLEQRVAERTTELARSNADLEQFAYVVSHDLQEPLRQIVSYAQLFTKSYRGQLGPEADEFIGYMIDGAQRMSALIKGLLAYARIGRGEQVVTMVDCNRAVNNALANLQLLLEESAGSVTNESLPTIQGNEVLLTQVFQNLIGNALKFRQPDLPPQIHITAEPLPTAPNQWQFAIRDNGIGIAPQYFERVFAIFQRLHTRQEYPGTGIGLALCKRIIEQHNGRIWIESQVNEGTTFYFTLPA